MEVVFPAAPPASDRRYASLSLPKSLPPPPRPVGYAAFVDYSSRGSRLGMQPFETWTTE